MKTTIIVMILLVSVSTFAQHLKVSEKTGLVTYEQEFNLDTLKAEEIYAKAYSWVSRRSEVRRK
jgi:DNA-binding transcriptional ArsR family regulator